MTQIKTAAPLVRETSASYRGRPLIIEAHAGFVTLRPKGTRTRYSVDWAAVFALAAKVHARNERGMV